MVAVKTGHLKATKTTTVLSVEDGMAAMRKARQASFRAPGESEESGPT
jgi:hypothetical protein